MAEAISDNGMRARRRKTSCAILRDGSVGIGRMSAMAQPITKKEGTPESVPKAHTEECDMNSVKRPEGEPEAIAHHEASDIADETFEHIGTLCQRFLNSEPSLSIPLGLASLLDSRSGTICHLRRIAPISNDTSAGHNESPEGMSDAAKQG
jgi:hypothetical protein